MNHEPKRTNTDFSSAFTLMLMSAREYGLDTTHEPLLRFLRHRAEVDAENQATIRHLYNTIHLRTP